uniref:Uncharacterized protein n=1 Tax=Anopheles dirus TaxID=7168 RepID=A0A182NX86_9DIPT
MLALNNLTVNMKLLGKEECLNDQRLLQDLVARLPIDLKNKWLLDIVKEGANSKVKSISDLEEWLKPTEELATLLLANEGPKLREHRVNFHQSKPFKCLLCNEAHSITDCSRFKHKTVNDRWRFINQKRLCANCCKFSNHNTRQCKLPSQCNITGCGMKHHSLLHNQRDTQTTRINVHTATENELYYQIVPVTLQS